MTTTPIGGFLARDGPDDGVERVRTLEKLDVAVEVDDARCRGEDVIRGPHGQKTPGTSRFERAAYST
jgi:hypothetical protein